ncbi:MAG TPA: group 1 truncated hemoglobin [Urbifossiella sp.]|nr:group 1 truncated hemoglobin [Urbifossiella sp.]
MRTRAAVAVWLFVVAAGVALAQPGPLDRTEQDRRTARVVHEASTLGSDLYNRGGKAECYRLFQGTLLAVQPMIDHRPKLALFVKEQLDKAEKLPADAASFELRKALDAVQAETGAAFGPEKGTTPLPMAKDKEPATTDKMASLWDRLGGEKAVRPMVKDLIAEAAADPRINFTRGGKYKLDDKAKQRLEQTLVELVSEAGGGPLKYSGKNLVEVHTGMKITRDEFNYFTLALNRVLTKHDLKHRDRYELTELLGKARDLVVDK